MWRQWQEAAGCRQKAARCLARGSAGECSRSHVNLTCSSSARQNAWLELCICPVSNLMPGADLETEFRMLRRHVVVASRPLLLLKFLSKDRKIRGV